YTGPQGSGVFSVDRVGTGADSVIVVNGTFTSATGHADGVFDFSIRDSTVHGSAVDTTGFVLPLNGSFNRGSGAIHIDNVTNPSGPPLATGVLQGDGTVVGVFDDQSGNSGSWSG